MGQQKQSRENPAQKAAMAVVERLEGEVVMVRVVNEGTKVSDLPAGWFSNTGECAPRPAPANIIAFQVKDAGLAADRIQAGSTLIVDTDAKREVGKFVVLATKDGGFMCKRATGREARSRLWVGRAIESLSPMRDH